MTEKTRDAQGRWVKGVSGNPKGRPGKFDNMDFGDLERFKNTILEVDTPHGRVMMTREAAIQERLYASAMKGNVHAQIHLSRKFEKSMEDKAAIDGRLRDLVLDIRVKKREPTADEALWIQTAREVLHMVPRPGQKLKKRRSRAKKGTVKGSSKAGSHS